MPKTYLQTAVVLFPGSERKNFMVDARPVAPEWILESQEHEATIQSDRVTIWWNDGLCEVYYPEGMVKQFWPKPTLNDAVLDGTNTNSYYRFHKNGSVEQIYEGNPYYWGPATIDLPLLPSRPLYPHIERCAEDEPFGYFGVYDRQVRFYLEPGSYYYDKSCGCSDCYFEGRQRRRLKRQNAVCYDEYGNSE